MKFGNLLEICFWLNLAVKVLKEHFKVTKIAKFESDMLKKKTNEDMAPQSRVILQTIFLCACWG